MITDRLDEDIRTGAPGWRWRWWMSESEIPTLDDIQEITCRNWGDDLLGAVAGASVEVFAGDEKESVASRDVEWGSAARELGLSYETREEIEARAESRRSAQAPKAESEKQAPTPYRRAPYPCEQRQWLKSATPSDLADFGFKVKPEPATIVSGPSQIHPGEQGDWAPLEPDSRGSGVDSFRPQIDHGALLRERYGWKK